MHVLADNFFVLGRAHHGPSALLALYILPTLIAVIRGTESLNWIIVINLLPTGIGWLAALIAALTLPRRGPQGTPQHEATRMPG